MAEQKQNPEKQILTNPENWDEMVKKYKEREDEQLKKIMESRDVSSVEELKSLAIKAMTDRSLRKGDQLPLKNRAILFDPKSQDIKSLRQQLNEEITSFFQHTMKELPKLNISAKALKGRVTIGGIAEPELQSVGPSSPSSPST